MVKRPIPPEPTPANLSPAKMNGGLLQLERRERDLKGFDLETIVKYDDPRVESLLILYNDTLMEIFGHNTIEYQRYSMSSFYHSNEPVSMTIDLGGGPSRGPDVGRIRRAYGNGIQQALGHLGVIRQRFSEKLADAGQTPAARATRTFGELDIHPKIAAAAERLFIDGHYANAVEDACKALQSIVQQRADARTSMAQRSWSTCSVSVSRS